MGMLGCCRVVVAQWSERRQLRSETLGSIPSGYPSFSILIYRQLLTNSLTTSCCDPRIVTKIIMDGAHNEEILTPISTN